DTLVTRATGWPGPPRPSHPGGPEGIVTDRAATAAEEPAAGGVASPDTAGRGGDLRSVRARRSRDATWQFLGSEGENAKKPRSQGFRYRRSDLRGARRATAHGALLSELDHRRHLLRRGLRLDAGRVARPARPPQ